MNVLIPEKIIYLTCLFVLIADISLMKLIRRLLIVPICALKERVTVLYSWSL